MLLIYTTKEETEQLLQATDSQEELHNSRK